MAKSVVDEFKEMTEAPPPKAHKFPLYRISGGLHGKNTVVEVDGERMERVSRVEVVFDVNDAVRVKTFQIAEVYIEVEVEPGNHQHAHTAVVYATASQELLAPGEFMVGRVEIARATADTLWEALTDCAKQLKLATKSDTGVAQAGTMKASSGRPPGH